MEADSFVACLCQSRAQSYFITVAFYLRFGFRKEWRHAAAPPHQLSSHTNGHTHEIALKTQRCACCIACKHALYFSEP